MANEIFIPAMVPGDVMYVVEFDSTGQAWRPLSSAFVAYTDVRSDFVLHRTTVGANGSFGPFDAQSGTTRWVAFVTTQSSGNESAGLDYSVWEDGVVRATDNFGSALATAVALGDVANDVADAKNAAQNAESTAASIDSNALSIKSKTDQLDFTGTANALKSESTNMRGTDNSLLAANYTAPPSTSAIADAVAAQANISQGLQTIATNLDAKVSEVEGGSGTPRPVNQTPVPQARVWILKPGDDALQGELPLVATLGDTGKLWAIDYRNDQANNGRIVAINSVTLLSGTVGGITFGNDLGNVDDYGIDRSQAKVRIGLVTPGTYRFRVNVEYDVSDGGGTSDGEVILIVKA